MKLTKMLLSALILLFGAFPAHVHAASTPNKQEAKPPKSMPEPSPEARKQMAALHQKMADCLGSTRPMQECRDEMRTGMMAMHEQWGGNSCGGNQQCGRMMGHQHGEKGGWY